MNPVIHFELPAENQKRLAAFYTRAFGWQTKTLGPEMGGYVLATTVATGKNGRPKKTGAINGGIYQKPDRDSFTHAPSLVIAVDDIKKHIKKVKAAGGKLLGGPMEIPGVGLYVSFFDPEGNRLSLLQPKGRM
jgi:hypothetical protein